jgi:hypothetical protein
MSAGLDMMITVMDYSYEKSTALMLRQHQQHDARMLQLSGKATHA